MERERTFTASLTLAVAILLTGCADIRWDTSWPTARPLGAEYETFKPPRQPLFDGLDDGFQEPTGRLTLREALANALLRNPRLAAFAWSVRAHEARALQAALPPNPVLDMRMEDIVGSDTYKQLDSAESTIYLNQLVEMGGKRMKRRRVADLDEDVAGWDYETERIDVLTHATQAFTVVLAAQKRLALADETVHIAQESLDAVAQEVEEKKAPPLERTRARVSLAAAQVDRDRVRGELLSARSNLAATWGSETEEFDSVEGNLEQVHAPPALEWLVARVETNPDLARWATEVQRRRAEVDLERAQRIPDITLAAGARRYSASDDTAMVVGVGVPLPLFDRNQGNILAARYELGKAEVEHRAVRLNILSTLYAADDRLNSAYREVTSLRGDVLPDAEQVYDEVLAEFDAGNYSYDDLLDTQRTLARLRSQYLGALQRYHLAVADVERLIGEPLQGTPAP